MWNIFVRYGSIVLAMVSGVIMVPLYLRFIPIDVYGAWLASGNILAWLCLIDPGLTIVLNQRVGHAYGKQDYSAIRELMGGGLVIAAITSILVIMIGFVFAITLPSLLKLSPSIDASVIKQAFIIAAIGTSLMVFSFALFAINQGLQSSFGCGLISIICTALSLIITIVLLYNGYGLLSLAISSLFAGIFSILGQSAYLMWRIVSEKIGISFKVGGVFTLAKLLSFTLLSRVSGIISNNLDLIVVSRFIGPETVSVLALTRKSVDFSKEFVNQPIVAFMPAVSHLSGAGEIDKAREVLMRLARILLWLLGMVVGGLIIFNEDFVKLWVGPQFFAGNTINLILCGAVLFTLASNCLAFLCFALGNIKGSSLAGAAQSLLFILLLIAGTQYFGLLGTVLAPLIAVLAVSAWYFPRSFSGLLKLSSQDIKDIISEIFRTVATMVLLILLFSWLHPKGWLQFCVIAASYCFLYVGCICLASGNFRGEIKGIFNSLPNKITSYE